MCPKNSDTPIGERLGNLDAYIDSLEGQAEESLTRLSEGSDSDSVKRQLAIFYDAGRSVEGAALARSLPPNNSWVQLGIALTVQVGETEAAEDLLSWVRNQGDPVLLRRCSVAFATSLVRAAVRRRPRMVTRIWPDTPYSSLWNVPK